MNNSSDFKLQQQQQQFQHQQIMNQFQNLNHRFKSQGKLVGLQRMRSQQNQKQNIVSSQGQQNDNFQMPNNQSQQLNNAMNNNVALISQLQNGLMSSRQSNTQRNYYLQHQQQQQGYNSTNNQQQQQLYHQLQISNSNTVSQNNTNNNSFNEEHADNTTNNNQYNNQRRSASVNRNIQNNSVDKGYQQLQKQHSHYSSNGRNSSNNNSGDLSQFRRSMNRLQQKPSSSSQQQNNSSRVLQVNKLFQNESFQIGDNQKKFFSNLNTATNVQQIDALQFPKSARKVLGGPSILHNHINGMKNDLQTFLPPLLDAANPDKGHQDQQNIIHNTFLDDVSHSQMVQPNNENEIENSIPLNQFSNSVSQPRNLVNSRNGLSNKVHTRSLSRQNMGYNNSKHNQDLDKTEAADKQLNQSNLNSTKSNGMSNSQSQIRKTSKKSSLNNIVKNIYNSSNNVKQEQPKVLSPTKNKSQNVFKISNIENRSNSVSGIYNSTNSNSNTNQTSNNSSNNMNQNANSGSNPTANFNQNVNGYYPSMSQHKQNYANISQNNEQQQSNQITPVNNNQNIMDDSVEEYLEFSQIPNIDPSKTSQKSLGIITAYGANTHQGTVRNYNEDRVSIILNMAKPKDKPEDLQWPNVSFFAVYDGHGGSSCAEYLRDNLHYYIIRDENFPQNPKQAIINGFEKLEETYLEKADSGPFLDKSGSCAIVALIIEKTVYIANVGDSRAILSSNFGKNHQDLSEDHKPSLASEEQRITSLGGHIYQSVIPIYGTVNGSNIQQIQDVIKGPHRAFPGRLAVSRTIGDAEAKLSKYGGIKGVISAEPEIQVFEIQDNHDYVLLGCDGIFDKMTSKETIQCCWAIADQCKNQHEYVGRAIENTMRQSMMKRSYDNVTVVIVGLKNLEYYFAKHNK